MSVKAIKVQLLQTYNPLPHLASVIHRLDSVFKF